jgi:hypothetical protein
VRQGLCRPWVRSPRPRVGRRGGPSRRKDEPRRFGSLGGLRQWIESIIDTLKDQLDLERHGGRTLAGVLVRVAQRLLALAAGVWFNWRLDTPVKRCLLAYDH